MDTDFPSLGTRDQGICQQMCVRVDGGLKRSENAHRYTDSSFLFPLLNTRHMDLDHWTLAPTPLPVCKWNLATGKCTRFYLLSTTTLSIYRAMFRLWEH